MHLMNTSVIASNVQSKPICFREHVIVVAELNEDGWSAWFRNSPQDVAFGECSLLAVLSLVETHGTIEMDAWDMTELPDRSSARHLEYLLPGAVTSPMSSI